MQQPELKSCPFCGGEASFSTHRTTDRDAIRLNNRDSGFGVNCVTCGVGSRTFGMGYATEEAAAARWNTRTHPTPSPGLGEDARDAARYRWIRENACGIWWLDAKGGQWAFDSLKFLADEIRKDLDAAIDAALAQPPEGAAP